MHTEKIFRFSALFLTLALILSGGYAVQSAQSGAGAAGKPKTTAGISRAADRSGATEIVLNGAATRISGAGAAFSDGTLTIRQPGTYVLSGKLGNGQVLIDAGKNGAVSLVLNGVSLNNDAGPAIYAPKSKEIALILERGTQNTVSDGTRYPVSKDGNGPDAAIFVQDNLSITGDGTLAVTGRHKHGIRAQDVLTITGGVISVDSAGDAIRGRDGIVITGGRFTLNAGADAIKSNNDKDAAKGFVNISGGSFVIQSKNDGIKAKSTLTISGGQFRITTGGGSAAAPARNNFRGGWGGGWGGGRGGWGQSPAAANNQSESKKGLKAGKLIHVRGGEFTIDAEDDAVHSNDKIIIAAGRFTIRTGDDGMHADGALEVTGGNINIVNCYEGLEGLSVTISSGNIVIASSDDAINAAEKSSDNTPGGRGPMMGWGRVSRNENVFVRITGGNLDIHGGTDGIDSNGDIFIEGGTIKISGPSMVMDGAIDFDGRFIVTGGEIISAGSWQDAPHESKQPVILISYSRQQPSGSVIAIKDSNGKTLLEYESRNAYSMSGFTSPSFKVGETYSLYIDGEKRTDIKLNNTITRTGENGASYNGGRGFGGFGGPGGGRGGWR